MSGRRGKGSPRGGVGWFSVLGTVTAAAGLGAVLLLFHSLTRRVGVIDEDAYISLRYARNLLEGYGLVFNPGGERVEGITNLLWTLAVSAGAWLGGRELPEVALALGVICGTLTLVLVHRWSYAELRRGGLPRGGRGSRRAAGPSALGARAGVRLLLRLRPRGRSLRTPDHGRPLRPEPRRGPVAGRHGERAAGSCCPDTSGRSAGPRPGLRRLRAVPGSPGRRPGTPAPHRLLTGAVPGFAVLGAGTLWRLVYYGSPVPNTAFAKAGGFEVVERWGLPYVVEAAQGNWFPVAWALVLVGALSDRGFLVCALPVLALVPAWSAYVVYVGGDYMPSFRLFVPVLPVLCALAVPAGARALGAVLGNSRGRLRLVRAVVVAVPVVALCGLFLTQVPDRIEAEERERVESEEQTDYRRAVAQLFEDRDPDALVAANAVGALGYYSEVRIVDMLGLNDAHIARHGDAEPRFIPGHQAGDGDYVLFREPDYIIAWSVDPEYRFVSDRELGESGWFREEYEPIRAELEGGYDTVPLC
ncbi:MAG: hypothetical protein H0V53_11935 [Rubrobacter sp.]|nr:hypothetical protein [Rubrobacter sp.]